MATIITRQGIGGKGSPLSNFETDSNFINLNNDIATRVLTADYNAANILAKLITVDGLGSGLDADTLDGYNAAEANTPGTILVRDSTGQSHTSGVQYHGSTSGYASLIAPAVAGTPILTLPTTTGNLVGTGDTGTVTNTMLAGSISNAKLANSSLTINSNVIALGSSITMSGTNGVTTTVTPTTIAVAISTTADTQMKSLGLGVAASGTSGQLNVNEIRATANITAYYSSDSRLKENISEIPNALDKVTAISGKLFDWTDEYIYEHGGIDDYFMQKSDFGVIAQDVQEVFPVAIREREDGYLAVDYEKLCALAFAAIKELSIKVQMLENKDKSCQCS
ncbi:Intramolecular chaperone auto-processing domain containing protein [uncultured Caudovirales phage]|uniref:Intramolecular chaperone auto-processing domain containing protein n=1 Tax=uncultured Caudovirales phage TaxID=2100421 RepID=A0A6J5PD72_9CAUD|nr:Intramolecular chaperone auto-processing domain containing protein [uncultured Caudovirales phage]CAB4171126.1 Intramolecular chaperone auto-processing domain containing protein [uncultured Caudovirales phage]CAB4176718.1 Intramolecular chaperone auto-processing domain containing protein [uncultured Caudovirales phage]CAB4223003.1 Intramolecular chaperone auto-processing domain containing protein [uncultured Caudovirales phage]